MSHYSVSHIFSIIIVGVGAGPERGKQNRIRIFWNSRDNRLFRNFTNFVILENDILLAMAEKVNKHIFETQFVRSHRMLQMWNFSAAS